MGLSRLAVAAGTAALLGAASLQGAWAEPAPGAAFVAGTTPSQRPADAPVVTEVDKPAAWYDRALFGVSEPYPASMKFLDDEGAWYTPFNRPGMTGPYDIRGWHTTP